MTTTSSATTSPAPVRRSALDAIHAALGARWISETIRWPESYGDVERERASLGAGVALAEPGPFDKLAVNGPRALDAVRAAGLQGEPGRLTPATPGQPNAWVIAPDQVLLAWPAWMPGAWTPLRPDGGSDLADQLRAAGAAVTDVSSGYTTLRLIGPRARDLLGELCPIDLHETVLPNLGIVQLAMANCRVTMARRDHAELPGFVVIVARDEAEHLWDVLSTLGAAHGLVPVGGAAITPPNLAAAAAAGATQPNLAAAAKKARR